MTGRRLFITVAFISTLLLSVALYMFGPSFAAHLTGVHWTRISSIVLGAGGLTLLLSAVEVIPRRKEGIDETGTNTAGSSRGVSFEVVDGPREAAAHPIRAIVIGAGEIGRTLATSLEANGRYQVVGFIDDRREVLGNHHADILGTRDNAEAVIDQYGVEEVFVAYAPSWQQRLAEQLAMRRPDIALSVVPTAYESMMRLHAVESYGDIAVVRLEASAKKIHAITKRIFDVVVSVLGLVLLFPLMAITAIGIKLSSRGPILFTQERTGLYGKSFDLYKLRTMTVDAESVTGPIRSSGKGDPRLTKIGRWLRIFRLDEIPQLWNVLRGDMSLVGPRPERPCFTEIFGRDIPAYMKRHDVRPGITGLAQICGGYHTDARDKLRFDLIYISHLSVWLDISLLLRTVQVVIFPERQKFEVNNGKNG